MSDTIVIHQASTLTSLDPLIFDSSKVALTDKESAGDLANILLAGTKSPKTKETYKQALISFILYLGEQGLALADTTKINLNLFKDELLARGNRWGVTERYINRIKPLSAESTAKYLAAIKKALFELEQNDRFSEKTLKACQLVVSEADEGRGLAGRYIGLKERREVMTRIDELEVNEPYKKMLRAIMALLRLGLRRAEIASLNVDSIKEDRITVTGKGQKTRYLNISNPKLSTLREDIMTWHDALSRDCLGNGQPLFFKSNTNRELKVNERINPQSIYYMVKQLLGNCTPHDFRRTLVSDLLDDGVDISQIKNITGHKSADMVIKYDRRHEAATIEAMGFIRL